MKKTYVFAEIERIKNQIVEKYKPEKVILFGSAVRKDDEIDDIDLFIIKKGAPYYGADKMKELRRISPFARRGKRRRFTSTY